MKSLLRTGLALAGAVLVLTVALFSFSGTTVAAPATPGDVAASAVNEADVVVHFGDGHTVSRHITFTGVISGFRALELAGFDLEVNTDWGSPFVTAIDGVGCPADDSFCGNPAYWAYFNHTGGAWQYSMSGAAATTISDGAIDGWSWGDGEDAPPPDVTDEFMAAQAALAWLKSQQQDDGGYGGVGSTLDTIMAVRAAGEDIDAWRSDTGNSMIDYLRAGISQATYTTDFVNQGAHNAGKLALALAAADLDPADFESLNLVNELAASYDAATGAFVSNGYGWWQALAMMGWQASGETIPVTATAYLASSQNSDGGWGYGTFDSDPDTTAMALQGLAAAGEPVTATSVVSGVAYLADHQDQSGAFYTDFGSGPIPNVDSTAVGVLGLLASDEDPVGSAWTTSISNSHPISYLLDVQLTDGSFPYGGTSNLLATQQAVWALSGKPFPYSSRAVALRKAVDWIADQQQDDGGFSGAGSTLDAIFALMAAGENPQNFTTGGKTPLDYLATQVPTYTTSADKTGKMIAGVVAARGVPQAFAGRNLVVDLMTYYNATTGAFGDGKTWEQSWAMLGLAAAGESIPAQAAVYLKSAQQSDGGWGYDYAAAWGTDTDSTALAIQALAAAGVDLYTAEVGDGFGYFRDVSQVKDGGFQYQDPFGTSVNSTGLGLQALAAYSWAPRGLGWSTTVTDGTSSRLPSYNPLDTLMGLQSPEGGFPGFGGANDPSATYQAVPGLAGKAFPLRIYRVYLPLVARGF